MTLAKTAGSNPEFNNTEQTTEMKGSMETQIPFFKPMVMPTTAQMAQVLGQKFDENIVAPVQMIAEEIAMNLRVAKGLGAGIAKTAAGLAVAATVMSCDKTIIDPGVETVNPNALTEKEIQAFTLRPDGSLPYFTVDIGDPEDPFFMPKMFRMEMEIVNAKNGIYKITPYISKKPIEDAINKAKETVPGKAQYAVGIGLLIKRADGSTYSPTSTVNILDKDDNNPSTPSPYLAQIPSEFTMDIFKQFSVNSTATKSYTLKKGDELQLWISVKTIGQQLATVRLPITPVQTLAIAKGG